MCKPTGFTDKEIDTLLRVYTIARQDGPVIINCIGGNLYWRLRNTPELKELNAILKRRFSCWLLIDWNVVATAMGTQMRSKDEGKGVIMTLKEAKELAETLTEMSTTGEDFLAGKSNEEIVIERYFDDKLQDLMTVSEAVAYARTFAIDGASKCQMALEFLVENDTDTSQLKFASPPLKQALKIIGEANERQGEKV